jgi:hypothetical protein
MTRTGCDVLATPNLPIVSTSNAHAFSLLAEARIEAPPADVWAALLDFEHCSWNSFTPAITRKGKGRLTVGERITVWVSMTTSMPAWMSVSKTRRCDDAEPSQAHADGDHQRRRAALPLLAQHFLSLFPAES